MEGYRFVEKVLLITGSFQFKIGKGVFIRFKAKVFKSFKYPQPLYVVPGEVIEG